MIIIIILIIVIRVIIVIVIQFEKKVNCNRVINTQNAQCKMTDL